MKKISIKIIKKVLSESNIDTNIVDLMIKEEENILNNKKIEQAEKAKIKEVFIIRKEQKYDDDDYIEEIEEIITSYEHWHDEFYDIEGLGDAGVDAIKYIIIGNNLYEVELHCTAEWVGDWSVRKNLPGKVSVTEITKIKSFEISKEYTDWAEIKIIERD